ncbi:MAG TPA: hypothetical protein VIN59_01835 [Alphaproteobacteria bacterium]
MTEASDNWLQPDPVVHQTYAEDDTPIGDPVRYSDLAPYFRSNIKDVDILVISHFAGINKKALHKARAYHILKQQRAKDIKKGLRILCDENASIDHLLSCAHRFNLATSSSLEGIRTFSDKKVWGYAVKNKIDLIITQDVIDQDGNDLTHIARTAWRTALERRAKDTIHPVKLPVLLHLTPETREAAVFAKALKRHVKTIFALHAQNAGPVLRLGENGVDVIVSKAGALMPGPAERAQLKAKHRVEEAKARYAREKDLPRWKRRGKIIAMKYRQLFLSADILKDRETPEAIQAKRAFNVFVYCMSNGLDVPAQYRAMAKGRQHQPALMAA